MATPPRQLQTQQIHFLRKATTFADNGTLVNIGVIPAGSVVLPPLSGINVSTGFTGSPQSAHYGPSTSTSLWGAAMALSATTFVPGTATASYLVAVDTIVQGFVTTTAAGAGIGQWIVSYIPNIDG